MNIIKKFQSIILTTTLILSLSVSVNAMSKSQVKSNQYEICSLNQLEKVVYKYQKTDSLETKKMEIIKKTEPEILNQYAKARFDEAEKILKKMCLLLMMEKYQKMEL